MIAFDAHLDLAWNAIDWNRDLERSVAQTRQDESGMPGRCRGRSTVAFPEMRRAKLAVSIATLLPKLIREVQPPLQVFRSRDAAYAAAQGQLAYYRQLERRGVVRLITDSAALDEHVHGWLNNEDADHPLGFIISMEGADAIVDPEQVPHWFEAGLRIVGPSHYGPGPYSHGTGSPGGLTEQGPALLRAMQQAGIILDVTHLADESFWQALDIYTGPVLASHHNCRALVPGDRQLTDEQIKVLIERGAVIGAAFDAWMLDPNWVRGQEEWATVGLDAVIDHIDYVCQLVGNAKHVGIGTDLDGGFGKEQSPCDLETIADLQKLPEMLSKRGYADDAIEGVMYRNWIDFFRRAWAW
jgi:membrane dipeptidase